MIYSAPVACSWSFEEVFRQMGSRRNETLAKLTDIASLTLLLSSELDCNTIADGHNDKENNKSALQVVLASLPRLKGIMEE